MLLCTWYRYYHFASNSICIYKPNFPPQTPDEVRAAWKTPPISPVRPPSASRRRDLDPGGTSNPRDESSRSARPAKFVSKLRAEAQLAAMGAVSSSISRSPVHPSSSDSGLSSWSQSAATATAAEELSGGHAGRSKSGYGATRYVLSIIWAH